MNYIVYEFYIVETGEIFYVGQGKTGRNRQLHRNDRSKAFWEVYTTNECASRILYDNLTQEESWELEKKIIAEYRKLGYPIVNQSTGGKNSSEGIDYSGDKNPMYGISPKERMDEETYKTWLHKQQTMDRSGEKNPNYGSTTLHEKYRDNPEYALEKQSRPGKQNSRCVPIEMYKDGELVERFDYKRQCAQYLIDNGYTTSKVDSIVGGIDNAIKNNRPYKGFIFKKLK